MSHASGNGAYMLFVARSTLVVVDTHCLPGMHKEAFKSFMRFIEEVGCDSVRVVTYGLHSLHCHSILMHACGSNQVHMASREGGYSFHVRRYCYSVFRFHR